MALFRIGILTLFPDMFPASLGYSLARRALGRGVWSLETVNIRNFAHDKHRSVDDVPFGGGPGMIMRADVVDAALRERLVPGIPFVYLSPRGRVLTQAKVRALAGGGGFFALCGRFEGVDQRVLDKYDADELSIGDYVLSSGEPAAVVLIDAVVRLLPGVVGCQTSLLEESFARGLLEYPHYTRPRVWEGRTVPDVLVSGHHQRVAEWRRAQAEAITQARRLDLWNCYSELVHTNPIVVD